MKRPTIADIAQRAGVTKAAVSFALNGQPGVSAATRERILAIAEEIGFQPNSAARALTDGRAGAFGLVIDRPARTLGIEPFFMQLISGIQAELAQNHVTLLFTMAEDQDEEIEHVPHWWAQRRVDGVFLVDLQVRRPPDRACSRNCGMPAVVIGTPRGSGALPAVWQDDRAAVETVVAPPGRARPPADRAGRRFPPVLAHQAARRGVRPGRRATAGLDGRLGGGRLHRRARRRGDAAACSDPPSRPPRSCTTTT